MSLRYLFNITLSTPKKPKNHFLAKAAVQQQMPQISKKEEIN